MEDGVFGGMVDEREREEREEVWAGIYTVLHRGVRAVTAKPLAGTAHDNA